MVFAVLATSWLLFALGLGCAVGRCLRLDAGRGDGARPVGTSTSELYVDDVLRQRPPDRPHRVAGSLRTSAQRTSLAQPDSP